MAGSTWHSGGGASYLEEIRVTGLLVDRRDRLVQKAEAALMNEKVLVWTLILEGSLALLRCDDGNDGRLLEKRIDFTDLHELG